MGSEYSYGTYDFTDSGGYWDGQRWVSGKGSGVSTVKTKPHVPHPEKLITLGGKLDISGFAKYDVSPWFDGLMLNCSNGDALGSSPKPIKSAPALWTLDESLYVLKPADEMRLEWPDQGFPGLNAKFWTDFTDWTVKHYKKLVVFCVGGHGRTGTAIACILMAACKAGMLKKKTFGDAEAVSEWIWDKYCDKAIESKTQDDYLVYIQKGLGL